MKELLPPLVGSGGLLFAFYGLHDHMANFSLLRDDLQQVSRRNVKQHSGRELPGGEQPARRVLLRRHGVQLLERGAGRRRLPGQRALLLRRLQERLLLRRSVSS